MSRFSFLSERAFYITGRSVIVWFLGLMNTLDLMYLLIVFLPLLGSSVAGFFGRFLGSEGTAIITTTCVSFSSILSLIAFYEVAPGASACYLRIAPWISSEMFDASWGFFGDREVTGWIAEYIDQIRTLQLLRGDTDSTRSYPPGGTLACRESRGDLLDVTTLVGWELVHLPFDRYTVEEVLKETNATGVGAILVREG